jgi:hypothetical protein
MFDTHNLSEVPLSTVFKWRLDRLFSFVRARIRLSAAAGILSGTY